MKEWHYLALLRGINVGGKNIIRMAALKECFEGMGFQNVATYIQSGNVIFDVPELDHDVLTSKIENALSREFNYQSRVVLVPLVELKEAVEGAPKWFGKNAAKYRQDVIFLKKPLSAHEAIKSVSLKEGVDQAQASKNVLYFARLASKAAQSHLPRIIKQPVYQSMTIRNWNTTTKLFALMEERVEANIKKKEYGEKGKG